MTWFLANAAALPDAELLPTGRALRDYWLAKLPEDERRILEVVVDRHPASLPRDEVSGATGEGVRAEERLF